MAINLSGLANSITDFIKGVGADLGIIPDTGGKPYPTGFDSVTSNIRPREAWNKLPQPYSFAVYDLFDGQFSNFLFKEFPLPIAPSQMSQSEDFAISIKSTQGGSVTSHSGNKFKTLSISGTTGVNPYRGMSGVDSTTGKAIAKPNEIRYKSGYEVFNELRNWFKVYYQYKSDTQSEEARTKRLVFRNFKDGEFLIVELLKFTMKRQAERSLLYDYDMEFRVLGQVNFEPPEKSALQKVDDILNNAVSKIDLARGIFLGAQEQLRNVESTYNSTIIEPLRKISLATKALAGIPITAADVGNRIIRNTITAAGALNILQNIQDELNRNKQGINPNIPVSYQTANIPSDIRAAVTTRGADTIVGLNEALLDIPVGQLPAATNAALEDEINDSQNLPRSFYEQTISDLKRISANAEDLFNLGSDQYDVIFDRVATLEAENIKVPTNEDFDILRGFNEAITGINGIISTQSLFKTEFAARIASIEESFSEDINLQALPNVRQITMPAETNLERIALEQLGDASRWPEIVELNDLKAPYVIQDTTDTRSNVVRPGETLLVPTNPVFGPSEIPQTKEIAATAGLSATEKSLGVDLKLNDDFDLALANNGDLSVSVGAQNMAQAILLKIAYEKGELLKNPTIGVGAQVGTKFQSLETIRDNFIKTLSQDPRISNLENISIRREGPALLMSFSVRIKNVDQPVPLTVKL